MSSNFSLPSVIDPLIGDLTNISREFSEVYERPPTAAEFAQILSEGIKWTRDTLVRDINGINLEMLDLQLSGAASKSKANDHLRAELPDAILAVCCNALAAASARIKQATGEPPTLAELCETLVAGLKGCPDMLLSDVRPAAVSDLVPKVKKRGKVAAKPGDIVAIPAGQELRFYLACVLAKNRFGTAYGFFEGSFPPFDVVQLQARPALTYAIYSGEQCLASGRWSILGHREDLLASFPSDPEIFHKPSPKAPFGLGETASERTRLLDKEEATAIGLLDRTYRQTYVCDFLETRLPQLLKDRT
jgi:hypothetical protein